MKIIVLGAGVIGVTTAYALGRAGHDVIVLDKESQVASHTSHANGAQLAYSYAEPFACPSTLGKLPHYLMGKDAGIRIRPAINMAFAIWGLSFLRNCTTGRENTNLHTMLDLAAKSKAAMETLAQELPSRAIATNKTGKLILTQTQAELSSHGALAPVKQSYGLEVEMLNKQACIDIEPALLGWQGDFCGGLYAATDTVLDPLCFCQALQKTASEKFAVQYKFSHDITGLAIKGGRISGVHTNRGTLDADAVILCLGNGVNEILRQIKDKQNIYPMQGYSLTLPLGTQPPNTSITDPKNKLVFANLGGKIRIAGLLDANLPSANIKERQTHLLKTAKKLWPLAANYNAPNHFWVGRRPMTPSSVPIVRQSKIKHLYYNIGHGSLGLTLAAGCAEKISGLVSRG